MRHSGAQGAISMTLILWVIATAHVTHHAMIFLRAHAHTHPVLVTIEKGYGANKTAWTLKRAGVIDDAILFRTMVVALGATGSLKAGRYTIPAHASPLMILQQIIKGKAELRRVTIPEGITLAEALAIIRAAPALTGDITIPLTEGMLLPETYFYSEGKTRDALIIHMRDEATRVLQEAWKSRSPNLPLRHPQEALVLASIVEKETSLDYERRLVAGVFIHRLRKKMKLQSDPTVIYGITLGESSSLNRPIRMSDLKKKTAWNTYVIDSLPPTPICLPGRASIEAVTQPEETDLLYFVADGRGGHIFAPTLEEHERNVKKWRSVEQRRKEEKRIATIKNDLKGLLKPRPWRPKKEPAKRPSTSSSRPNLFVPW